MQVPSRIHVDLLDLDSNGPPRVLVKSDLTVHVHNKFGELVPITIPADENFISDGASVPRPLHWVFSPFHARSLVASLIHDWLLKHRPKDFDFKSIDRAFKDIQRMYRQKRTRRWFLYIGTRIGSCLRGPY